MYTLHCLQIEELTVEGSSQAVHNLPLSVVLCNILKFYYRDHISEYPQALKVQVQGDKMIDSDEPASKKPRIYSYPKLLFEKLRGMTDPVGKVCYSLYTVKIHCI